VDNGVTQTRDQIFSFHSLLVIGHESDSMNTVQRSASFTGCSRTEPLLELAHNADAVLVGQLMRKLPVPAAHTLFMSKSRGGCSRRNIFRILSTDLKNRVHLRIDLDGTPGVGRNLVNGQVCIQEIAHHVSP